MLLTGFRRMEVLAMRKEWVQPDDNLVRFPDTKSGPQMRVAGDAAMTVLEAQALRSHSPYIFPGTGATVTSAASSVSWTGFARGLA
jgi:integrase